MRGERVEPIPKQEFTRYLRKADEACRSMKDDLQARRYNSAGLQAVQTAVSSADSLTVFYLGLRSTAQSHLEVLSLLRRIPVQEEDQLRRQIASVLDVKSQVQYEPGTISERTARRVSTLADRILSAAIRLTGNSLPNE